MTDLFKQTQEPYMQRLIKVNKAKEKHHKTCEKYRFLLNRIQKLSSRENFTSKQVLIKFIFSLELTQILGT